MAFVVNVPVTGDHEVAPVLRVQPTVQRVTKTANVGWQYRVRYTLTNTTGQPLVNHPYALNLGATNALVSGSKALASGNDLRVAIDGREVARTLVGWNTGATSCWIVVPALGPGASLTIEVLYGNASAGSPPTLAYPSLPAFDLATSSNAAWKYLVNRVAANAGLGGWYLSGGASQPATVDQTVPGAWRTLRTLINGDDSAQEAVSTYVDASVTYWHGRFQASRGRSGSITGGYVNNGDGVGITVPVGIASVRAAMKILNPEKGGSGTSPVGRLVILTKSGANDDWVQLYSNTTAYNTETAIGVATYTPPANVLTLAFAVWPYDAGNVDATAQAGKVAQGGWDGTLELNLNGSAITQTTAQAETAVYELATELRIEQANRDGRLYTAVRLGNQQSASGIGTPRLTAQINQVVVIDTATRVPEVWDSALSGRVETPSPATATAADGVTRNGTTVEQPAISWLAMAPVLNPLTNPDFAAGVANWERGTVTAGQTVSAQTQDGAVYDSSPGSLRTAITASTAGVGAVVEDRAGDYVPTNGRGRVWVAAATRSSNANLQPTLTLWFYDASNAPVGAAALEADYTVTANTWTRRLLATAVPTGATQCKVGVTTKSKAANSTGSIWIDTVTVNDNDATCSDVSGGTIAATIAWVAKYA